MNVLSDSQWNMLSDSNTLPHYIYITLWLILTDEMQQKWRCICSRQDSVTALVSSHVGNIKPSCEKSSYSVGVIKLKNHLKREQHWEYVGNERPYHPGIPAKPTLYHQGVRNVSQASLDVPAPTTQWIQYYDYQWVRLQEKMNKCLSRRWFCQKSKEKQ